MSTLQNLDTVLQQFGLDSEAELAHMGMKTSMFRNSELLTDIRKICAVLEHCAEITASPDFALRLAATQNLSFAGGLALFIQTANTLGEALRDICRCNHVYHAQPVSWALSEQGNCAILDVFLDTEDLSPRQRRLATDLALCHGYLAIKTLTEGKVRLERVKLRCNAVPGVHHYRRFFQAPVEFNADTDGLVLPEHGLNSPLVHRNAQMHEAVRRQISPIVTSSMNTSMLRELRTIIRTLLPTADARLERVAQCYGCDKRTLQRHLRDEADTHYQALLDDVRFELVLQLLCDSRMPMTQLSYVAGFSDPSNFSRAFRKRFGIAPKQWREQHIDSNPPPHRRVPEPELTGADPADLSLAIDHRKKIAAVVN